VLQNARIDLSAAADVIYDGCLAVTKELRLERELPEEAELQRRLELLAD
jgi:hypothetical protein